LNCTVEPLAVAARTARSGRPAASKITRGGEGERAAGVSGRKGGGQVEGGWERKRGKVRGKLEVGRTLGHAKVKVGLELLALSGLRLGLL
jgi:hypothetical protein